MKLSHVIEEYLDYQRALGKQYRNESYILKAFQRLVGNVELRRITSRDVHKFIRGKKAGITNTWYAKYCALKKFFRYANDQGCELTLSLLPAVLPKRPNAFTPYIYTVEEIQRLLGVSDSQYSPRPMLAPITTRTLILLLYGAGLRLGEAINLRIGDVNLREHVLTIRDTKFFKSRLVPIGQDLAQALKSYHEWRRRFWKNSGSQSDFFCTKRGTRITADHAHHTYQWLRKEVGVLRTDGACFQTRLHDFRHTFAITRLVTWYREGKDVQRLLPALSTYLGHVDINATAKYLTMTKELLREASRCFERYAFPEVLHG
jgi:integrase/recombinase XerD